MTETTDDNTTGDTTPPPEYSIEDFITAYTKKAWAENGTAILAHAGDGITVECPTGFSKVVVRQKTTETKITRKKSLFGAMGETKENIAHEDTLWTLTPEEPTKDFVNNAEKTEKAGVTGFDVEIVYDFNHYFTLEASYDEAGNRLKSRKATPPPPPSGDKGFDMGDITPWIIGGIVIVIIIAVVYFFFLRGKTIGGYRFGPAPVVAQASPVVAQAAPVVAAPQYPVVTGTVVR